MDYYEILGVPKSASEKELKSAYKKKSMQHHPDRTGGDDSNQSSTLAKDATDRLLQDLESSVSQQHVQENGTWDKYANGLLNDYCEHDDLLEMGEMSDHSDGRAPTASTSNSVR